MYLEYFQWLSEVGTIIDSILQMRKQSSLLKII